MKKLLIRIAQVMAGFILLLLIVWFFLPGLYIGHLMNFLEDTSRGQVEVINASSQRVMKYSFAGAVEQEFLEPLEPNESVMHGFDTRQTHATELVISVTLEDGRTMSAERFFFGNFTVTEFKIKDEVIEQATSTEGFL